MDVSTEPRTGWGTRQAYVVAIVCFALGTLMGYLYRSTSSPAPAAVPVETKQAAGPHGSAAAGQPTPEQIRHAADKLAEPLLAKLKASPDDPDLLAGIGNIYYDNQQFKTAVDFYERSIQRKPSARTLTDLGNAYYYAGDAAKALAAFERALSIDSKSADALFNLGMIRWRDQGDPKGAVEAWQKLIATNPNHPQRKQVEEMIARAKQHMNIQPGTKPPKPSM